MLINPPLGAPTTQACIAPKPTDAELITPAVIQALLGFGSETPLHPLRPNPPAAKVPPHPPAEPEYNKFLRRPGLVNTSSVSRAPRPRGRINNTRAEYFTPRDYRCPVDRQPPLSAPRPKVGITPELTDAELITLAVIQALLGFGSEACVNRSTVTPNPPAAMWFPCIPGRAGYNKAPTPQKPAARGRNTRPNHTPLRNRSSFSAE